MSPLKQMMSLLVARGLGKAFAISCAPLLFWGCGSNATDTAGVAGQGGTAGQAGVAGSAGSNLSGGAGSPSAGQATGGTAAGTSSGGVGGAGAATGGAGGSVAGTAGQGGAAPMLEPGLRWLGRVEKTATGARIAWPGTGFTARFNGTAAKVSMKTNQIDYFQLVVDGQVKLLTTQVGAHDYDVAQNLPAAEHTVTLWRRTENNAGVVEITKVDFVGTLLSPPPPSNKRLEIVGDSISVGFGVECQTQAEAFSFATENNYQTYEAISARELGAELMTMAWSGMGMWRDVGGSTTSQMPEHYLRAIGSDAASKWDFASYTPGAVVVLLGTNDFAKGDPGQPFLDAYKQFVADMRGRYPLAHIFLAHSPMLSGDRGTALAGYLDQVKSARAAAGDLNIGVVDFKPPAADAWGCGHPNGATHAIMAGVLTQALKQDLGW